MLKRLTMVSNNKPLVDDKNRKDKESLEDEIPLLKDGSPNDSVVPEENVPGETDLNIDLNIAVVEGEESNVKDVDPAKPQRKGWRRYIGIMFALGCSVTYSLSTLIVKIMTKDYHPISISVWRFQGVFWPSVIVLLISTLILKDDVLAAFKPIKEHGKWKVIALLMIRCVCGVSSVILQFFSVLFMKTIGDSTVIFTSAPVFVTIVAYIFLGESCGIVPTVNVLLTILGVVVISRPPFITGESEFNADTIKGVSFAFASMIASAMVFVLLRGIRKIHYAVLSTCFGLLGSVVSLILTTVTPSFQLQLPQGSWHWFLAVSLGLLTFLAQGLLILSLKFEEAGIISLCRTCDVIFAFIWQAIFLHVVPDIFSYVGAVIVIFGVFVSALRKWVGDLPEGHATRKKLSFLLY